MIIDKLENSGIYKNLGERILIALDYLQNLDTKKLTEGKFEIEGDKIFALISFYNTKNREDCFPEAHRKYIDVQYVAEGEELIGYVPFDFQKVHKEYNENYDFMLYDAEPSFVKINKGMFAIFYPEDLHMPGIKISENLPVKKVVIKVKV